MADCERLGGCIFFNDKMANMPSLAEMYKKTYCRGDSTYCARYMVLMALGKEKVPDDLFPNATEKAGKIIKENRK